MAKKRKKSASRKKSTRSTTKTARSRRKAPPSRAKARLASIRSTPSEELKIAVSFRRGADGLGLLQYGARMTTDVVKGFRPDEQSLGTAIDALTRSGFRVTARGKVSVSIRGKRRDFERAFGTKLTAHRMRIDETTRPSAGAVYFPAQGAPWSPDPLLAAAIDDAYIQWPHVYMNSRFTPPPSPLPPQVSYHHLRVPGDVALLLNASRVHREGITGAGVRVAMIDSGFAHGHPYFEEHGYSSAVDLAPGATHGDRDGNGHGTGESANLLAVAPDVTFIGVKLDNESDSRLGASILEGLQVARNHDPQVISVSLGYDLVPTNLLGQRISNDHLTELPNSLGALEAEIEDAVADGIAVVFSAGNGHVAFPGMMPDVISAGGVFVAEEGGMRASDYASAFASRIYPGRAVPDFCGLVGMADNLAEYIMLPVQPGCEIDRVESATDGTEDDDGWGVFSGTSAAAPQLAGVCALLLEANPSLTPGDLKEVLRRTSRDVVLGRANPASNEDQGGMPASAGPDGATGGGLVDAFAALRQV